MDILLFYKAEYSEFKVKTTSNTFGNKVTHAHVICIAPAEPELKHSSAQSLFIYLFGLGFFFLPFYPLAKMKVCFFFWMLP